MDDFSPNGRTLTRQEQALREVYVEEYLKDFKPINACLRLGFDFNHAQEYSESLMQDPYVQKLIAKAYERIPEEEQTYARDKALVLQSLRQAAQHGPYASRVAACAKLAAIHGFDKSTPVEDEDAVVEALREFGEKAPV